MGICCDGVFVREVEWDGLGGVRKRGYFHKWVVLADRVYAVVELEDGTVGTFRMKAIRFVDNDEEEEERKEDGE